MDLQEPSAAFAARMRHYDRDDLVFVARQAICLLRSEHRPEFDSIVQHLNTFIDGADTLRITAFWELVPFASGITNGGIPPRGTLLTNAIWRFLLVEHNHRQNDTSALPQTPSRRASSNMQPIESRRTARRIGRVGGWLGEAVDFDDAASGIFGFIGWAIRELFG
ncbi:MAG: hypothetical protein ACQR33_00870 [Candidatus Saccharibacteria bacterium]